MEDTRLKHEPSAVTKASNDQLSVYQNRARLKGEVSDALAYLLTKDRTEDIAATLGYSPKRLAQMLTGNINLTLEELADVFMRLGRSVHITLGTRHDEATEFQDLVGYADL